MKVAVVQFAAGTDKDANLATLTTLVGRCADAGADLVVGPEASMHPFGRAGEPMRVAERLDGPFVTGVAEAASNCGVTVLTGMFESVDARQRPYNTVVAVDPDGLFGVYRKLHLFDALGWRESESITPGPMDGSGTFDASGRLDGADVLVFPCADMVVGVLTCYDVRFPELARRLVDRGSTLLALVSAWVAGPLKEDQWSTLVRARAIESTCYVAASAQCPPTSAGRALIVDPTGVPLAQLTDAEGIAVADATAERLAAVRATMPALRHRRYRTAPAG